MNLTEEEYEALNKAYMKELRDFEGIFGQAASMVRAMAKPEKMSDKVMLKLYGLYKVATLGMCIDPPPSMFNIKAKAKWKSWIACSEMNRLEAMKGYVKLARHAFCWDPYPVQPRSRSGSGDSGDSDSADSGLRGMGNSVSAFAIPDDDDQDEGVEDEYNPAFSWARDGCTSELAEWIKDNEAFVNVKDGKGMTLLHWAVDRGHLDTCKVLLEAGANPTLQDKEGTSPLEYAETCEHDEIVTLLKEKLSIE